MTHPMDGHHDSSHGGLKELAGLGGSRPDPSSRARDVFPLPLPPAPCRLEHVSRRASQKWGRRLQEHETVKEAVNALNWMAGQRFLHGTEGGCGPLRTEVLLRIQRLAREAGNLGSLERVPTPEAALRELLKGKSEYNQPENNLERVSLPESLHDLPEACDLLPDDARRYLLGEELMIREGTPVEAPRPYWDPVLAGSKKHYKLFVQRLNDIGLLQFTQHPKNEVGACFVHKSDGKKIRLIVDARSTNSMFKEPPGVDMCSSEGFSRIECELFAQAAPGSQAFLDELQSMKLFVGLSDVKDCFHRLKQPHWVGMAGKVLDDVQLGANYFIYPMPGSL